jgi:hypothetical protein
MKTTTQAVDLLGDPLPEPLPENLRLTRLEQLVGHTILGAFESRQSFDNGDSIVLVTQTNCWMVIDADTDGGSSSTYAQIDNHVGYPRKPITDYVEPAELLEARCITQAEHDAVVAKEAEEKRQRDQARADRLRAELRRLEGQSVNGSK